MEDMLAGARRSASALAATLSQLDELLLAYGYGEEEMLGLGGRPGARPDDATRGSAGAAGPLLSPAVLYATIKHSSSALAGMVQQVRALAESARSQGVLPGAGGGGGEAAAVAADGTAGSGARDVAGRPDQDSEPEDEGFVLLAKPGADTASPPADSATGGAGSKAEAGAVHGGADDDVARALADLDAWVLQYAAAAKVLSQPGGAGPAEAGAPAAGAASSGTPASARRYGLHEVYDPAPHAAGHGALPSTPLSTGVPGTGGCVRLPCPLARHVPCLPAWASSPTLMLMRSGSRGGSGSCAHGPTSSGCCIVLQAHATCMLI